MKTFNKQIGQIHVKLLNVWLSPSQKCFVSFESPLKKMKNAFYFIIKTLFVLQIFKFLSWLFSNVEKIAWFSANMYLFKLNNKNTIEKVWNMFINVFLVFYCSRWAYFTLFSCVFIGDFEQVNVSLEDLFQNLWRHNLVKKQLQ